MRGPAISERQIIPDPKNMSGWATSAVINSTAGVPAGAPEQYVLPVTTYDHRLALANYATTPRTSRWEIRAWVVAGATATGNLSITIRWGSVYTNDGIVGSYVVTTPGAITAASFANWTYVTFLSNVVTIPATATAIISPGFTCPPGFGPWYITRVSCVQVQ